MLYEVITLAKARCHSLLEIAPGKTFGCPGHLLKRTTDISGNKKGQQCGAKSDDDTAHSDLEPQPVHGLIKRSKRHRHPDDSVHVDPFIV